jgi:hypothetical protein
VLLIGVPLVAFAVVKPRGARKPGQRDETVSQSVTGPPR